MNEQIYDKAIKYLAMRLHTTGELFAKLKTKGFDEEEIRVVLLKLEENRFLDDQKFAEIFVDNLKRYKDFGYFGIKAKLLARKIPSDILESALAEYYTKEDEEQVAKRLVLKINSRGGQRPPAGGQCPPLQWQKLARALQTRGFRSDVIRKVLNT